MSDQPLPPPDPGAALRRALASLRDATPQIFPTPAAPAAPVAPIAPMAPIAPAPGAGSANSGRRAINATGSIFHPTLGGPPLANAASAAWVEAMTRPQAGRHDCAMLLVSLTGAEAALVVDDALSGLALALMALAGPGGEVVVARGDLFAHDAIAIADLVAETGARLIEVGSVDRTDANDVRSAITPATRVLLQLHRPFAIDGEEQPASPAVADLAELGRAHGLPVMHALGGGGIDDDWGARGVAGLIADGADLVVFSADRLLGGPRAGILVGRDATLGRIAQRAMTRAARPDRATMAALAATLALHATPVIAARDIPALRLLAQDALVLEERAIRLAGLLGPIDATIDRTTPAIGGGVRPVKPLESRAVSIGLPTMPGSDAARRLAAGTPSIAAARSGPRLQLDIRSIGDHELGEVAEAVRNLSASPRSI